MLTTRPWQGRQMRRRRRRTRTRPINPRSLSLPPSAALTLGPVFSAGQPTVIKAERANVTDNAPPLTKPLWSPSIIHHSGVGEGKNIFMEEESFWAGRVRTRAA